MPLAPAARAATPRTSSSTRASTPPYTRPGEPAWASVNVQRARTSAGTGSVPGGGSVGRWVHSTGGACGFRRPDPACNMLSSRPSGWRTRKIGASRWRDRRASVIAAICSAAAARSSALASVITTAVTSSRTRSTSANDASGIDAAGGNASPSSSARRAVDTGPLSGAAIAANVTFPGMTTWRRVSAAAAEPVQRRAAAALRARGLAAGDRVAVVAPSSPSLLAVALGALRTGVVPVLLNPALLPVERDALVADADPALVLRNGDVDALVEEGGAEAELSPMPLARPMHYTSGTTGPPKGVWSGVLDDRVAAALLAEERELW